jgi:hypothetical protein
LGFEAFGSIAAAPKITDEVVVKFFSGYELIPGENFFPLFVGGLSTVIY